MQVVFGGRFVTNPRFVKICPWQCLEVAKDAGICLLFRLFRRCFVVSTVLYFCPGGVYGHPRATNKIGTPVILSVSVAYAKSNDGEYIVVSYGSVQRSHPVKISLIPPDSVSYI